MSWHLCERWWAQEWACAYHRDVEPEESEDEDDEEDGDDPRDLLGVPARNKTPKVEDKARASVAAIEGVTVPYVVAVEPAIPGPVISNWHGTVPNTGGGGVAPSLPPPPDKVFEGFQTPSLVPPGGVQAIVPGGFPPPPSEGSNPGNVFNPWDSNSVSPGPGGSGIESANVGRAIGIGIAAGIATAIVATITRNPTAALAAGSRISALPWFAAAHAEAFEALRLAERSVIDSINETALLIDAYQADYKERLLQSEATEQVDRVHEISIGPRLLIFNAAARMEAELSGIPDFGGDI